MKRPMECLRNIGHLHIQAVSAILHLRSRTIKTILILVVLLSSVRGFCDDPSGLIQLRKNYLTQLEALKSQLTTRRDATGIKAVQDEIDLMQSSQQQSVRESAVGQIEIVKATWWADQKRRRDVTSAAQEYFKRPRRMIFLVRSDLYGVNTDIGPNVRKHLTIEYKYKGKSLVADGLEGDIITIPQELP